MSDAEQRRKQQKTINELVEMYRQYVTGTWPDICEACRLTGGKAIATFKQTFTPVVEDAMLRQFEIEGDLTIKLPKPRRPKLTRYVDEQGNLSVRDPNQPFIPGIEADEDGPRRNAVNE